MSRLTKHTLLALTLALAPIPAFAQDTTTTETTTEAAGDAVTDAAAATGDAAENAGAAVNNATDPNNDGVVDSNNNGRADTREFPWGLLGLAGLAGLLGRNKKQHEVHLGGPTDGPRR